MAFRNIDAIFASAVVGIGNVVFVRTTAERGKRVLVSKIETREWAAEAGCSRWCHLGFKTPGGTPV